MDTDETQIHTEAPTGRKKIAQGWSVATTLGNCPTFFSLSAFATEANGERDGVRWTANHAN